MESINDADKVDENDEFSHEDYFTREYDCKKRKTSKNSLSLLLKKRKIKILDSCNKEENENTSNASLLKEYRDNYFNQWIFELSCGYSLFIYGVGFKRNILNEFVDFLYGNTFDYAIIVIEPNQVNQKSCNFFIKELLQAITKSLLKDAAAVLEIECFICGLETVDFVEIRRFCNFIKSKRSLFLDDLKLVVFIYERHLIVDEAIELLLDELINDCSSVNIQWIFSSEIRSSAVFIPFVLYNSGRLIFHELSTFIISSSSKSNFLKECLNITVKKTATAKITKQKECSQGQGEEEETIDNNDNINDRISSLVLVLKTLTENARIVFKEVAEHYISAAAAENDESELSLERLLQDLHSKHLISESSFNAIFKEFNDHSIMSKRKDGKGNYVIYSVLGLDVLQGALALTK